VDPSAWEAPSTKDAVAALEGLAGDGSVLVVLADGEEACAKSFRNIAGVSVLGADQVGVADVVGAARLVVSEGAHGRLSEKARATQGGEEA
jgi:large subunit ribosomal protein L4